MVHHEKKIYILENLGCAHCASKMEQKIQQLPEVEEATLTFATRQLCVIGNQRQLLPKLQKVCASVEAQVVVREKEEVRVSEEVDSGHKKEILWIAAGAVLFVGGILLGDASETGARLCFLLAYLILGSEIVWEAGKNLFQGKVFDENFLMSLATIAAFGIGEFAEAVGIMLFYRVGECFEEVAVEKSRKRIMEAVDMRPEVVGLWTEHGVQEIPAKEAKVGDVLVIRVGDRIPLDGTVVQGESRIDTAPVTGEPVPVRVQVGDEILSGCINTAEVIRMRVEQTLEHSMVTRILEAVEQAAASKPKIDRFITRFARIYTPVVVGMALATAILPSLFTGDWSKWIYTAITFLVISCPCALVLSVPLAFFSGIGAGSKQGILFKGGASLETLHQVKTIVMDKTGTITKGNFKVESIQCMGAYQAEEILSMAAICEQHSNHPIANSIMAEVRERALLVEQAAQVEEIAGKGIKAVTKQGVLWCGNRALMELAGMELNMQQDSMGVTKVFVAKDGEIVGSIAIADELKEDAKEAIQKMKALGYHTIMLTGDEEETARRIGEKTGIQKVYAKLLPREKLEKLEEIRREHGKTLFVGDGINDAPVLAGADVGAAMGSGADAAMEAADLVFMASEVSAITEAVKIADRTNRIAVQNVVFALGMKALVMVLGLFGVANMWLAVFADTGVAMLCVLNAIRILYQK